MKFLLNSVCLLNKCTLLYLVNALLCLMHYNHKQMQTITIGFPSQVQFNTFSAFFIALYLFLALAYIFLQKIQLLISITCSKIDSHLQILVIFFSLTFTLHINNGCQFFSTYFYEHKNNSTLKKFCLIIRKLIMNSNLKLEHLKLHLL